MAWVYDECCEKAGIDSAEVKRITKGLSRYAKQAENLGITIFGGSASGSLIISDDDDPRPLILAELDGSNYSGGDGATCEDEEGLMRGE